MLSALEPNMPPRKNFALRLNPELYAALERWAADDLRSVNAQIEYLLTQSVRKAGRWKAEEDKQEKTAAEAE